MRREGPWPHAGILLIHGGPRFARWVFRREGRGYWSQALGVVLEKHGYLGFEEAGPEALLDPRTWQEHAVVLVARLPDGSWTDDAVSGALAARGRVLVEGPLPATLAQRVGIEPVGALGVEGAVLMRDARLERLMAAFGLDERVRLGASVSRSFPRKPDRNWEALGSLPITPEQAAAWRRPSWDVEAWRTPGDLAVLAEWDPDSPSGRHPAIVTEGSVTCCSFSLFSAAAWQQTAEPYPADEHRVAPTYGGTEALLLALIDAMFEDAKATRARVLPWPAGTRWVRSVRHDFDRPLTLESIGQVLAEHERAGSAATWYWRARHAGEGTVRVASASHHEVELHTEQVWTKEATAEEAAVEEVVGRPLRGSSAHGDPTCFRWQGAPNVLWAEFRGWDYTEMLLHDHQHPHRFPWLATDGNIQPLEVICLSRHISFESGEGQLHRELVEAAPASWSGARGLLQVLNHPDINVSEFFEALRAMPADGRADWTAGEAVDWWARTHVAGELQLWPTGRAAFGVSSRWGVAGLAVELRDPDGGVTEQSLDLKPFEVGTVSAAGE